MAQDLTVQLEDRPGSLAKVGETLAAAGINIEGVFAHGGGGQLLAHVLVEDGRAAQAALQAAGFQASTPQDVVLVAVQDRPGVLGEVCRKAAGAGINLTVTYLATGTRLVLGADDLDALRQAVGG
jgi:hypothetical protein